MRVTLFITCFNDTLFPRTGRAVVELLERLGHEVEFPEEQTCCGQMHANSGYQLEAIPLARRFVDVFGDAEVVVSPVGIVRRRWSVDQYPRLAELAGDPGLAREVAAVGPRVLELSELLVDRLGVEDVGAVFPHRVTYHPTCHSLRLLRRRRPAAAAAAGGARDRARRAARGRGVLRLRRHLRGQERRHLDGDAQRQAPRASSTPAPRSASPPTTRASCTSAAGCVAARTGVRTAAPGRDPGGDGMSRDGFAGGRRGRRSTTPSCGATSARRPRRSEPSAPPSWASCPTGRSCATPARRSRRGRSRRCPSSSSGSRRRSAPPAGPCTGRATRPRRTRSWPGSPASTGATRWSRSSR